VIDLDAEEQPQPGESFEPELQHFGIAFFFAGKVVSVGKVVGIGLLLELQLGLT
jgi:hypothetical protein